MIIYIILTLVHLDLNSKKVIYKKQFLGQWTACAVRSTAEI
jgi:hypothetical protein